MVGPPLKCKCSIFFEPCATKFPILTPCSYVSSAEVVGKDIVIHLVDQPVMSSLALAHGALEVLRCCSNLPEGSNIVIDGPGSLFLRVNLSPEVPVDE